MNLPLESENANLECLTGLAESECANYGIDIAQAQGRVAQNLGFKNWNQLETTAQRCCEILDPSTVRFNRTLETGKHRAWQLITDQDHLSSWMFETKLELRVGGTFEFPTWKGVISKLEDLHCIRFTAEAGGYSQFEISSVEDNSTLASLIDYLPAGMLVPDHLTQGSEVFGMKQHGGPGTHWAGLLAGWHSGSDSLEAYASNRETAGDYMALVRLYEILLIARNQD